MLKLEKVASPSRDVGWVVVVGDAAALGRIVTLFNVVFDHLGIGLLAIPNTSRRIDFDQLLGLFQNPQVQAVCTTVPVDVPLGQVHIALDGAAQDVGAVSAVRRNGHALCGALLDGVGFVEHLKLQGFEFSGARVLLCGGLLETAALAHGLTAAGCSAVDVQHFDEARALSLLARLKVRPGVQMLVNPKVPSEYDLIVYDSEQYSGPPLRTAQRGRSCQWIANTSLLSRWTPFMRQCAAQGATVCSGIPFLKDQVRLYLDFLQPSFRFAKGGIWRDPARDADGAIDRNIQNA